LCAIGVALLTFGAFADETYTVKPKDTLYNLAREHGISVGQLAARNGLTKTAKLYVGQRLIVPSKSSPSVPAPAPSSGSAPAQSSALIATAQKAIDSARVSPKRWRYIVIHHSGVDEGTMKGMDRYHRDERHMEHGLAYHFVIGNGNGMGDGEIGVGQRWREQLNGGHLASEKQNTYSLGICLVGNFDNGKPTPKQMQSLTALLRSLMRRCNLSTSSVRTHQQINIVRTRCPGRYFSTTTVLRSLSGE